MRWSKQATARTKARPGLNKRLATARLRHGDRRHGDCGELKAISAAPTPG
jgi:hypothetical protein